MLLVVEWNVIPWSVILSKCLKLIYVVKHCHCTSLLKTPNRMYYSPQLAAFLIPTLTMYHQMVQRSVI